MKAMKPKKNKPFEVEKTSSPGKVFHSRASKPSGVQALGALVAATNQTETNDNLDLLQAKLDELLAALKK
jgi:hypothetical protein